MIIGVHTPEFAFEHVASNVAAAVKRLGIRYPVVQDNNYATWDAYRNEYWPAEYLIDRKGHIRHYDFGEGGYGADRGATSSRCSACSAKATRRARTSPRPSLTTPETYLGYERLDRRATSASTIVPQPTRRPTPARSTLAQNTLALLGQLARRAMARSRAGTRRAARCTSTPRTSTSSLGGHGTVQRPIAGRPAGTIQVDA